MARAGEGDGDTTEAWANSLSRSSQRAGCRDQLPHRARGEPEKRAMGRRLPPTQHRQSEQQVLAQLAAQPQSQVPVLGRLL